MRFRDLKKVVKNVKLTISKSTTEGATNENRRTEKGKEPCKHDY